MSEYGSVEWYQARAAASRRLGVGVVSAVCCLTCVTADDPCSECAELELSPWDQHILAMLPGVGRVYATKAQAVR